MKIFYVKTNGYNCIVYAEGREAIVADFEPYEIEGSMEKYEDTANHAKAFFEALEEVGDLNDFSQMPGDRQEIGHDLFEQLANAELIFSDGAGIEIWSVELAPDFADDTFCGTLEECREYCEEYGHKIGENCRIAKISVDDHFCAVDTLEIVGEV